MAERSSVTERGSGDSLSLGGGTVSALLRALGTMLGLHIQYAQREVKTDVGRVIGGVVVLLAGGLFVAFALLFAHLALIMYLDARAGLGWMQAVGAVAAGDLLLALVLVLTARARLRKPMLEQTRSLVRRTVSSLADL